MFLFWVLLTCWTIISSVWNRRESTKCIVFVPQKFRLPDPYANDSDIVLKAYLVVLYLLLYALNTENLICRTCYDVDVEVVLFAGSTSAFSSFSGAKTTAIVKNNSNRKNAKDWSSNIAQIKTLDHQSQDRSAGTLASMVQSSPAKPHYHKRVNGSAAFVINWYIRIYDSWYILTQASKSTIRPQWAAATFFDGRQPVLPSEHQRQARVD